MLTPTKTLLKCLSAALLAGFAGGGVFVAVLVFGGGLVLVVVELGVTEVLSGLLTALVVVCPGAFIVEI